MSNFKWDFLDFVVLLECLVILVMLSLPMLLFLITRNFNIERLFINKSKKSKKSNKLNQPLILAVFPTVRGAPPLALRDDFITFITSLSIVKVVSLIDDVPYVRLVKWVKRLVATNKKISMLYIASHGVEGGVAFTDQVVDSKRFATLVMLADIDVVMLMVCDGYDIANALRRHGVKSVVYIDGKIYDKDAIKVTQKIISGLSDGLTLKQSADFVKAEIDASISYAQLRVTSAEDYKFDMEK